MARPGKQILAVALQTFLPSLCCDSELGWWQYNSQILSMLMIWRVFPAQEGTASIVNTPYWLAVRSRGIRPLIVFADLLTSSVLASCFQIPCFQLLVYAYLLHVADRVWLVRNQAIFMATSRYPSYATTNPLLASYKQSCAMLACGISLRCFDGRLQGNAKKAGLSTTAKGLCVHVHMVRSRTWSSIS